MILINIGILLLVGLGIGGVFAGLLVAKDSLTAHGWWW